MAIRVGAVISGFKIDAELGQGGMSRVYRATQLDLRRRVALKVMAPHLAADPQYRARFLREARTAAGVDHPNVLPVYQAGEADDVLWLAMRYVDGGDLRQLLEWLKQHPRLSVKATGPIIGMDVVTEGVDAEVPSGYKCGSTRCVWLFRLSKTYFALLAPNKNSVYEMKVGPDTVLVGLESSPDELTRFRAVAFSLLRSLHLGRPG